MTPEALKDYRKTVADDYTKKDTEIETSLTYISAAALGFFITINEKFVELETARYHILLAVSLFFLFLTFVLILIRKSKTVSFDHELMTYIDSMEANNESQDSGLLKLWKKGTRLLECLMNFTYVSLSLGIGLQVLFLVLNLINKWYEHIN